MKNKKMETMKSNPRTTQDYLIQYVGATLESNEIDPLFASYCFEYTFGEDIHSKISNYIEWANNNEIPQVIIQTNLLHDLRGALAQDKLMLPRVSSYVKTSQKK
jgi:hypothetical protein